MQEYYNPVSLERAQEFFTGNSQEDLDAKMNARQEVRSAQGFNVVKRVKVGRNETCPCGSGVKFKKCCLDKAY